MEQTGFPASIVDSRRLTFAPLPNHQLQTVAAYCGYDLSHHHALAEAEACAWIRESCYSLPEAISSASAGLLVVI